MRALLFWSGLYAACLLAALAVTPGLPEALGFTLPVLAACAGMALLLRKQTQAVRRAMVVATAAVLLTGAVTGAIGHDHDLDRQTATAAVLG